MYRIKSSGNLWILLLWSIGQMLAPQVSGQQVSTKIDKKDLRSHIKILTSPELEGRSTGTEGNKKAAQYIAECFESLSLKPYHADDYFEKFELKQGYRGSTYLKTSKGKVLKDFEDIIFIGSDYYNEEIEKEVVFAGHGTEEELAGIEVEGRIVMVFASDHKTEFTVKRHLKGRKPESILIVPSYNPNRFESQQKTLREHLYTPRFLISGQETEFRFPFQVDSALFLNTLLIPVSEAETIMNVSYKKLQSSIEDKKIGEVPVAKVRIKFERVLGEVEAANVLGFLKGKSDKTIIVSAHYDHLGKRTKDYYPGADDNASGVAALLELAEAFSKREDLEYSILFMAIAAEELGLLGSLWHVNHPDFKPEQVLCNINLDMISRIDNKHQDDGKYLYCIGSDAYPWLHSLLETADSLYDKCRFDFSLNDTESLMGLYRRTDSYCFFSKGIPALFFTTGLHPDYHKPSDTIDKIDFSLLESRVRQVGLVIEMLREP